MQFPCRVGTWQVTELLKTFTKFCSCNFFRKSSVKLMLKYPKLFFLHNLTLAGLENEYEDPSVEFTTVVDSPILKMSPSEATWPRTNDVL